MHVWFFFNNVMFCIFSIVALYIEIEHDGGDGQYRSDSSIKKE